MGNEVQERPMELFRNQLEKRLDSFADSLPPQITVGHFKGVIMRAVMADPALLGADRVSLFESALAAANDGLLPDKREGAFVIYNAKVREGKKGEGKETWVKKVQWMPMIRGIFTKLYNTGQVRSAKVAIVYGGDHFRTWTDDAGDHIEYEEAEKQDRKVIRTVFAHVVMKDGGVFVETMKPEDVEKIRSKSKAKDSGPWVDWWEEMAKKSVFRRLAKRLPMSRTIMPLFERDDAFFDLEQPQRQLEHRPTRSLAHRLDDLAGGFDAPSREYETVDQRDDVEERRQQSKSKDAPKERSKKSEDGSSPSRSDEPGDAGQKPSSGSTKSPAQPDDGNHSDEDESSPPTLEEAYAAGAAAREAGKARKAVPQKYRSDDVLLERYLAGFDGDVDESEPGEEG